MAFEEQPRATAGKSAGLIASQQRALEPARNRALLATDQDLVTVRVCEDGRHAAVARETPRRVRSNAGAITQHGDLATDGIVAGSIDLATDGIDEGGIDALGTGSGVDARGKIIGMDAGEMDDGGMDA